MSPARVVVLGLGPGDERWLTEAAVTALSSASVARLRTRRHPAAERFADVPSYDEWYERADSFETLYPAIVDDLVALAETSAEPVFYAVPGSPMVAERTVELLLADERVEVTCWPAVSVVDATCAALGVDPMARGLRVLDALDGVEPFRGPGPLLILQTYAPEVLLSVADRLPPATPVTVVHHAGLDDQVIVTMPAARLHDFTSVDHLTSLWVDELRTPGVAVDDLVDLMNVLREECVWDQEQTHASLTRHLLEEAYEALDALEQYAAALENGEDADARAAHAEEELGDLLFQIVFHARLGVEEERFSLTSIADAVREKLISRHPHVFGDADVATVDEAASQWEALKKVEKQRTSVTDGIAWQLPSLTLHAKLLRKARAVGVDYPSGEASLLQLRAAVAELVTTETERDDAEREVDREATWRKVLSALSGLARWNGVDLENVMRAEAIALRDKILGLEALSPEGRAP